MTNQGVLHASDTILSPKLDKDCKEPEHEEHDGKIIDEEMASAKVEKVHSAARHSDIDPLSEPPDGGLNAWLKVFGCFLLYSNIWGFTLSFGAFQAYYQTTLLATSTPSAISWIGTIQSWFLIMVGVLSGPLFDMGYFRSMLILGNFGVIFGVFMLSLSKTYWQVFLSQGVCMGLGAGFLYVPSLALIGLSFSRKLALAQGIVMSGIAVGGISYIVAFDRIITEKDFAWAIRIMGFMSLALAVISFPALVTGTGSLTKARTKRKLLDKTALRDKSFWLFSASTFMTFLGYMTPYFYISQFAQDAIGLSQSLSLYMLVIATAGSFFGRLMTGVTAHYLGPILTWLSCVVISGILCLSWIAVRTRGSLIVFSVFWGFCSAGLVTLPAAVFPRLCPDPRRLGTRIGMSWGISSFGSLIGTPISGALLKTNTGPGGRLLFSDYLPSQLFAACCLLTGAILICCLWLSTIRKTKSTIFI
ncbi:major facilitator superfamily domain-containing protein [Xylariales sp. PMI_506]|nr:major facilitator superfamily domain-containing protein [Xylariales sp. PMI_506]